MNVRDALWMFVFMYPGYLLELLAAEGMLLHSRQKRPFFWAFLIPGIFLILVAAFAACCLLSLAQGNAIVGALGYMAVFLCTLAVWRMCYEVPFKILLFFGAGAYAFQNLCYRISSVFELSSLIWPFENFNYNLADGIFQLVVFAVSATLFYFFFVRKVSTQGMESLYSGSALLISLITLIITVVFCSVTNSFWWMSWQLSLVNYSFAIVANFFILWIQSGMLERIALKSDVDVVRSLWQQDKRQYEIAKETIELINIKCHDMKHKIMAVHEGGSALSPEEAAEIESYISIYDAKISTGCEPIDVLLTEKSLICNETGIRLSCMVDGKQLSFIRDHDLYSLFGNMLSNAIEAVRRIDDKERRCIDLTVQNYGGMALINCVNYFSGELKFDGDLPRTSKTRGEHGYGLKSIRMLVKKYGGEFDFSYSGNVFSLRILFPLQKTEDTALIA